MKSTGKLCILKLLRVGFKNERLKDSRNENTISCSCPLVTKAKQKLQHETAQTRKPLWVMSCIFIKSVLNLLIIAFKGFANRMIIKTDEIKGHSEYCRWFISTVALETIIN